MAMELGEDIHATAINFPSLELYNLSSQIRRAADSIALNIAEGSTGTSDAEQRRFLNISIRSCCETVCCLHKARKRSYIDEAIFQQLYGKMNLLAMRIQKFRNSLGS